MKFITENFKYFFYALIAIIIGAMAYTAYTHFTENKRLHKELIGQREKYEQLNKHTANLERQYVEQKELRERAQREWGETAKALRGRIKVLSNATYLIRERARKENRSDLVYSGKRIKYVFNEIRFNEGPPVGYVIIFDNGKVVSKIYNHEIDVKTAISRDEESGKYDILSKADFVLRSGHLKPDGKNWFGVPFPLEITGGAASIDPTEPNNNRKQFYFWSPRYNFGANLSTDGIAPGLGVSLMGYGYSKRDLDFKLLELGVQYEEEDELGLTFKPVLWRPFSETLPNTYIGPGINVDQSGTNYFMGISLGF